MSKLFTKKEIAKMLDKSHGKVSSDLDRYGLKPERVVKANNKMTSNTKKYTAMTYSISLYKDTDVLLYMILLAIRDKDIYGYVREFQDMFVKNYSGDMFVNCGKYSSILQSDNNMYFNFIVHDDYNEIMVTYMDGTFSSGTLFDDVIKTHTINIKDIYNEWVKLTKQYGTDYTDEIDNIIKE